LTQSPPPPLLSPTPLASGSQSPPTVVVPAKAPVVATAGSNRGFWTGARIAGIAIAVLLLLVATSLGLMFLWRSHGKSVSDEEKVHGRGSWVRPLISPVTNGKSRQSNPRSFATGGPLEEVIAEEMMRSSPPVQMLKAPPSFKGIISEHGTCRPNPGKSPKMDIAATAFSVADLQAATNSFAQENLIGEGSLSRVYRGDFPNGQVPWILLSLMNLPLLPLVSSWEEEWKALELSGPFLHPEKMGFLLVQVFAVKKLDTSVAQLQNKEEFLGAVCTMAHLQHANITELVGYCAEHGQRLLVYQYVNRGTLNDALHTSEDSAKRISWNTRVKIALGAARALEYLHEVCLPAIVHRNFKSANILLDDEINPHLSDCGIAALTPIGVERQVHFNL
jgi:hypothetical protein